MELRDVNRCVIANCYSSMLLLCSVGRDVRRAQALVIGISFFLSFFLCGSLKPRFYCATAPLQSVTDARATAEKTELFQWRLV